MKNVMIPEELFGKIIKYHLLDQEQEADLGICSVSGSCMCGDIILLCEISSLQIRDYRKDEYSCIS